MLPAIRTGLHRAFDGFRRIGLLGIEPGEIAGCGPRGIAHNNHTRRDRAPAAFVLRRHCLG